jgi:hypothetical protein
MIDHRCAAFAARHHQERVAASAYRFQTLAQEVVRSLPFHSRRAEKVKTVVTSVGPGL